MYNYNPKNSKDFFHNANVITQYFNINEDKYYDFYHNTALIYVAQIDKESVNNFADYIKNNSIKTVLSDAVKYIQNKEKKKSSRRLEDDTGREITAMLLFQSRLLISPPFTRFVSHDQITY